MEPAQTPTRGAEPRARLVERIAPAIVKVLNEYDLSGTIAPETLAEAIVAQLVSQSPRLKARERLLAEADGAPECWICKLRIPMDAANDTAECFSIDHVVPRAQGGTHLGYENLRPAHRLCNAVRDMGHPSPKLLRSLDDMMHRLRTGTPDYAQEK